MQAILLATGETQKLKPLTERIPSPMVTIMNRPVMVYNLELLGRMGFKRILVSVHSLANIIERYFGDGQRWGVSLEYILQRDGLGSAGALGWAKHLLTDHFIVIPADQIADLDLSQAIAQHISQRASATVVVQRGSQQASVAQQFNEGERLFRAASSGANDSSSWTDTGIYIFDPLVLECIPPRQLFEIRQHLLPALHARGIQLQTCSLKGYWNPLNSFQDYIKAQNTFLARAVQQKNESEQKVSYQYHSVENRQVAPGIWSGKNVRIHPTAKVVPMASIGSNSWIGRDAELGPGTVIGSNVVIDEGATIKNSIILNNTYIGKLIHLENRLVKQDLLVDINTNDHVQVTDPVMLGKITSGLVTSHFKRPVDFCLAILLLLFALPVMLVLAILLLLTTGKVFTRTACSSPRFSRRKDRTGQTETFDLLSFKTRKTDGRPFPLGAWLECWEGQRLPELLNVIKGDLALVGLKPVVTEPEKSVREAWHFAEERIQAGFTGQWYLHTDEQSPLEDSLIADTYYLAMRSRTQDWRILRSTPAAWFSKMRSRTKV